MMSSNGARREGRVVGAYGQVFFLVLEGGMGSSAAAMSMMSKMSETSMKHGRGWSHRHLINHT